MPIALDRARHLTGVLAGDILYGIQKVYWPLSIVGGRWIHAFSLTKLCLNGVEKTSVRKLGGSCALLLWG